MWQFLAYAAMTILLLSVLFLIYTVARLQRELSTRDIDQLPGRHRRSGTSARGGMGYAQR